MKISAAHAEEGENGKGYLQVFEEHIHKVAGTIKILTKRVPLQLSLFMQATLEIDLCPSSLPYDITSQRELDLTAHDQAACLGHQHRNFLAGCKFIQGFNRGFSIPTVQSVCAENVLNI